jgi:drug/metabolite transporter (DMT)-like permease
MDRTGRGMALMLGFCATAPLIDVASKLAADSLPVGQITAARFAVQAAIMALPLVLAGQVLWPPRAHLRLLCLRALLLMAATFSFVSAIRVMPLADALAIAFVEPFLLMALAALIFGDPVGPRRIAAALVGFAGALLVIQPSLSLFGLVALWPLLTAVTFAGYMLATRALAARMDTVSMQFHTSTLACGLCLPLLLIGVWQGVPDLTLAWPQGVVWLWLIGVGATSALAHWLMTQALRFAPSATLAPLHYLELISAVLFGLWVFGDFPNLLTWAGIGVIALSGLYIIHRERVVGRTADQ